LSLNCSVERATAWTWMKSGEDMATLPKTGKPSSLLFEGLQFN